MKWLKRIALTLAALLLAAVAALWWLLGSQSGLRFALDRAEGFTHGALRVEQARGHLTGPMDLAGLQYDDGSGTVVKVAKAHLRVRLLPLLTRRVHVLDLEADGVELALPQSAPASQDATPFSLKPPVQLLLDRVHVGSVAIRQGNEPLFVSSQLDLSGSWTDSGLVLKQLALQAPDGHVQLGGTLAIGTGYAGTSKASFRWKVGDIDLAGQLDAHSDGNVAHLTLALTQPSALHLRLDLTQSGDYPWTAALDVPRFDPQVVLGDSSLDSVAATLKGQGDRYGGTLDGRLDLNDYPLLLQPLRARFNPAFDTLTLQQLNLSSPRIKGTLAATGTVQWTARPVAAALDIRWTDLLLPQDLVGQALASHGVVNVRGSMAQYHAEGDVAIGPPGKLAALSLDLDGSTQALVLHTLALEQAQGTVRASGTLTLQPTLAWQAQVDADRFDPGQLFAGWNGALDFALASNGTLPDHGPDATLEIQKLGGKLRQRAVNGHGKLHLSPNAVVDGSLDLASGGSTIRLDAKPGASNDAELQLAIASLSDWIPDASGRLDGHLAVRGKWPGLSINGQLRGQTLGWQQQKVDALHLIVGVPDIGKLAGKLDLRATGAYLQGMDFQQIDLLAEGSQRDHRLSLDARGRQLSGQLALHGSLKGTNWDGTLGALDLAPQGMPEWRLQHSASLRYRDGAMAMSELCLTAGDPQLCAAASRDKGGNLDASYRLHALPLALLLSASGNADLPLRADGTLEGRGKIRRNAAGALTGTADLSSASGAVTYTDRSEEPLLRYQQLRLSATFAAASQRIELHSTLDDDGRLDGHLTVSGAQRNLAGQLDLHLRNLAFIELLSSDVANARGRLDGSFGIAGTLQQPAITGRADLADFAAELPAAGLKLSHGSLAINTLGGQQFRLDGSVQSGQGSVAISGVAGIGAAAQTAITVKGSGFTAADIPAARVVISPDLVVKQDVQGLDIGGNVAIDSAEVNVDRLSRNGGVKGSRDVVVVDQQHQEQAASQLPITARVKVDLGRRTHVVGMGLDGRVSGMLTVSERPGHATTGQGQVAVDGTYHAYGQNLQIQRGQLLFASTPIDNPGLNIRATRKLSPNATVDDGQEVGLYIAGTAQRPVLTVFSNPVMEQSDALSYLITGKPLSDVSGGEGDIVGAAAQALGSAAGNLLAKRIGSQIGLDDIGVSSNQALGGESAFSVGKYLSPRLYLSYGVGLFEPGTVITLRYRLSHRWNFEAQNATDFSRASFNYRIEK
jgi:translocation and assembly module TamB